MPLKCSTAWASRGLLTCKLALFFPLALVESASNDSFPLLPAPFMINMAMKVLAITRCP